jgi:spore germination cell wall hydrolase CwlJ-like protein
LTTGGPGENGAPVLLTPSLGWPERLFQLVRRQPRLWLAAIGAAWVIVACGGMLVHYAVGPAPSEPVASPSRVTSPVRFTPADIRPLSPVTARQVNANMDFARGDNPAARPFPSAAKGEDFARALECLTQAIYYEAANEPESGQKAVAQVVLNRVRHPAYPSSVCGVVYQGSTRATGCQFTFTCDGSLARAPSTAGWARAERAARAALAGEVFAPVGYATHYHADYVVPYWSDDLLKSAAIGAHIFYRMPGAAGLPRVFASAYRGAEPIIGAAAAAPATALALANEAAGAPQEFTSLGAILPTHEEVPAERAKALDEFGLLAYREKRASSQDGEAAAAKAGSIADALCAAEGRKASCGGIATLARAPSLPPAVRAD